MTALRWLALAALATGCGPILVRDVTLDGQDLVIEKCQFSSGIFDGGCTTTREHLPAFSAPFVGMPPHPTIVGRVELLRGLAGERDALAPWTPSRAWPLTPQDACDFIAGPYPRGHAAAVFGDAATLKGGVALELRTDRARTHHKGRRPPGRGLTR